MIVHHDADAGSLYLDLAPGVSRPSRQPAARDVTIDLTAEGTCAGLRLAGISNALPPTAQTALLRYCPELVGGAIRPDWEAVRLRLLIEAGVLPHYPVRDQGRSPEPAAPAAPPAGMPIPVRHGLGGLARALRHPRRGGAAA